MKKVLVLVLAMVFLVATAASAGDFSPKVSFKLSKTKVKANPAMEVRVEQDSGEEELGYVKLTIPKGFNLPTDAKIPNADRLGSGQIFIAAGPGCNPNWPADEPKQSIFAPATLEESDRTDDEADSGVKAAWVLNISGVTKIRLAIRGSRLRGWKLEGDIPANDNTCPPFSFVLTVNQKSSSGVPIIKNPAAPGRYRFTATFVSQDSPTSITIPKVIRIRR